MEQPNQHPEQVSPQSQPIHQSQKNMRFIAAIAITVILCSLVAGLSGYLIAGNNNSSGNVTGLQQQVNNLQNQIASLKDNNSLSTQVTAGNVSLSQLYSSIKNSVVVIIDQQSGSLAEGSGFVYNLNGRNLIITNNHVVASGVNISVTFENGDGYAATVLGTDPYADLAVLSTDAPANEFNPLQIASSSSLNVGDFVAAVGSPFGLAGSMTTGIISALGRTITETYAGNYPIADVIQFSAPINPGNSGGPLVNAEGQVVGINTAGVEDSQNGGTGQGVGFAIPSDTILREVSSLANSGSYTKYSYMGIGVVDMSYDIAAQIGAKVTHGVLVETVVSGGPADKAGIKAGTTQTTVDGSTVVVGGDIITAINGSPILNQDSLSAYLTQNTLPNETISVTLIRGAQTVTVQMTLGTRSPAS